MTRPPACAAGAGLADLHIHSLYSDGTLTPEEILALARGHRCEPSRHHGS